MIYSLSRQGPTSCILFEGPNVVCRFIIPLSLCLAPRVYIGGVLPQALPRRRFVRQHERAGRCWGVPPRHFVAAQLCGLQATDILPTLDKKHLLSSQPIPSDSRSLAAQCCLCLQEEARRVREKENCRCRVFGITSQEYEPKSIT